MLLTSRNGNHAAGFVGDECDEPVERGGASSSVRGGAMVSHAPAKCRRAVAYYCSSPSKVDPSGVAPMPQANQTRRKMIECIFGWGKQHGTMRKTKHRGLAVVAGDFLLNLIAYNLIRIPKLMAA